MASSLLSGQVRKALDAFLNSIEDQNLETFVQSAVTQPGTINHAVDFGSKDFQVVYIGDSSGHPEGRYMIEIRANKQSSIPALQKMATSSHKLAQNQKRFAFLLIEGLALPGLKGEDVKAAFRASPNWEAGVINKVHVRRHPRLPIVDGRARFDLLPRGLPKFEIEMIPFAGFNVDGTKTTGKQKQAGPSGSKK